MRQKLIQMALALMPFMCQAQSPGGVDLGAQAQASRSAAQASLPNLARLAARNSKALGFATPTEAQRAELSSPMSDFIIGLDTIRKFRPGTDPMSLLRSTGLVVYPVLVEGTVRSSVTMKKQGSEWKAVAFGAPGLSGALKSSRDKVLARANVRSENTFQVRIPAFHLTFVGHVDNGHLMLTPADGYSQYGFEAGTTLAAEDVLSRLQPEAEHDDEALPR